MEGSLLLAAFTSLDAELEVAVLVTFLTSPSAVLGPWWSLEAPLSLEEALLGVAGAAAVAGVIGCSGAEALLGVAGAATGRLLLASFSSLNVELEVAVLLVFGAAAPLRASLLSPVLAVEARDSTIACLASASQTFFSSSLLFASNSLISFLQMSMSAALDSRTFPSCTFPAFALGPIAACLISNSKSSCGITHSLSFFKFVDSRCGVLINFPQSTIFVRS
jgi:hypothetical protein